MDENYIKLLEDAINNKGKQRSFKRLVHLPLTYDQFEYLLSSQAQVLLDKKRLLNQAGEPKKFIVDEHVKNVIKAIYDFTQGESGKGIALVGAIGCGKSLIMTAYVTMHNIINDKMELGRTIYNLETAQNLTKILVNKESMDIYAKQPMLIDEVGREAIEVKNYGTSSMPMKELFFERYNNSALTHITSNFSLETLSDSNHYGNIIGSRFYEMFNFIEMKGTDRRKEFIKN